MKYIITTAAISLFSTLAFADGHPSDDATHIQNEIETAQKAREDADAEIKALKVKLEKVQNEINSSETKIEEIQAKISAKQ